MLGDTLLTGQDFYAVYKLSFIIPNQTLIYPLLMAQTYVWLGGFSFS